MYHDLILWDDEDDPEGNYWHIVTTGLVTLEEVEEVISSHRGPFDASRSTGLPIIFGTTSGGRHIAVVFVVVPDPELVLIRPVSAYPVSD